MKNLMRGMVALIALVAHAKASDQTVTINAMAGDVGSTIETTFEAGWSQGDYTCAIIDDRLVVFDTSGDCDETVSRYNFVVVGGGGLNQDRSIALRIQCASPLVASVNFDGNGFVALNVGQNLFTSGSDTIRVGFSFPLGPLPVPTMPEWGLILLTALCLAAGVGVLVARG